MATDTYLEVVATAVAQPKEHRRLPVGVGLSIAAGASLSLWVMVGFAIRSIFG